MTLVVPSQIFCFTRGQNSATKRFLTALEKFCDPPLGNGLSSSASRIKSIHEISSGNPRKTVKRTRPVIPSFLRPPILATVEVVVVYRKRGSISPGNIIFMKQALMCFGKLTWKTLCNLKSEDCNRKKGLHRCQDRPRRPSDLKSFTDCANDSVQTIPITICNEDKGTFALHPGKDNSEFWNVDRWNNLSNAPLKLGKTNPGQFFMNNLLTFWDKTNKWRKLRTSNYRSD